MKFKFQIVNIKIKIINAIKKLKRKSQQLIFSDIVNWFSVDNVLNSSVGTMLTNELCSPCIR